MAQSINTSYAVIVLGDRDTVQLDDLADKAAQQGALIAETYSFDTGEPATHDDIGCVDAVVAALSRAIVTRTDLWMPFPMPDLGREEHIRRISLVLQRHGVNLVMGRDLEPCTTDCGFNPIDFALRAEVRAVDALDNAAVAAGGARTLIADIERELHEVVERNPAPVPAPRASDPVRPPAVGERTYGTADAARFFGKSMSWLFYAMRSGVFCREDGSAIGSIRAGKDRPHRFTVGMLREMARACYRRGILDEGELLDLLGVLERAEEE